MEIYTSAEEASRLIKERWNNKELRNRIAKKLNIKMNQILVDGPSGILGRNIGTPDGEFSRFISLNKKIGTKPIVFEHTDDKLVTKNISKYSLVNMPFCTGNLKDSFGGVKNIKIIDFNKVDGKKISALRTLWNENLVDFHHRILLSSFPEMKNRSIDMSLWFKGNFEPEKYYELAFSLSIAHSIYFEDFFSFDDEDDFVRDIVLPAFKKVSKNFDVKPIIVRISKTDNEYRDNPHAMFYPESIKDVVEKYLENVK